MASVLGHLEPNAVWRNFEFICNYPHPSKKEDKLVEALLNWAKERNIEVEKDEAGNFVMRKPATPGMENRRPITVQGHVDMVCEKNADVEFDFDNDAIQVWIDGDWVKAKGTTLGADNGIGVAMGMALLESTDIAHPDLEVLCTLDEETGMTGVLGLSENLLKGQILINLDSEEDGAFTIGCAGGLNTMGSYKIEAEAPAGGKAFKLVIKGLRGGHSGIEIHDGRGNAAKFMTRLLANLSDKLNVRIADFNSGNKHNAIPREAFATVVVSDAAVADFNAYVKQFGETLFNEYKSKEPGLTVFAEEAAMPAKVWTANFQTNILRSFYLMPHGVYRMSPDIAGLVQTSTNMAIVETHEDEVYMLTSQRSSMDSEKRDLGYKVKLAMEAGGAVVSVGDGYPAWEPNINSPILQQAAKIYEDKYGNKPVIEAIHAGLECGLIGEKYPNMDMLSFGPNLEDVHSPDEKIQISSTAKCWDLLVEIIKNTPEK
jgi:dipeptidase D